MNGIVDYTYIATDGESVWYLTDKDSLLMKLDIKRGEIYFETAIPKANSCDEEYRTIIYHSGFIYVFPFKGNRIWKYDTLNHSLTEIRVPKEIQAHFGKEAKIYGGFVDQSELIVYGLKPFVISCCVDSDRLVSWEVSGAREQNWFWKNGFRLQNDIVVPVVGYERFVIIRSGDNPKIVKTQNVSKWFSTIVLPYNNDICFIGIEMNGDFIVDIISHSSYEAKRIIEFKNPYAISSMGKIPYSEAYIIDGNIILFPGFQCHGWKIAISEKRIEEYGVFNDNETPVEFFCAVLANDRIVSIDLISHRCFEYDPIANNSMAIKPNLNKESLETLMLENILYEDPVVTLETFLECV